MRAKVAQDNLCGQCALGELGGDARNEHLAAVTDREQARDPVDRRSEIVAVAFLRVTGVDGDAHGQPVDRAPIFLRKRALRLERGCYRRRRRREYSAKGVSNRLENVSTVSFDR